MKEGVVELWDYRIVIERGEPAVLGAMMAPGKRDDGQREGRQG